MALFKSAEEKEAIAKQKEYEMMQQYGLQSLTNPDDITSVRKIIQELSGTGMMELGVLLGANEKYALKAQMLYQRALIEQNFIIIRQLDRIASKLDK